MTELFKGRLGNNYQMAGALILSAKDEITAENPEKACRLAISILAGACRDIIIMKPADAPGAADADDKQLTDALTDAALGILAA